MIALHAAAALGAFAVAVTAIDPRRARSHRWSLPVLVGLLVAMTVFLVAAMAAHWTSLPGASQVVFTALVGLAIYMVFRAVHASSLGRRGAPPSELGHVDDVGF